MTGHDDPGGGTLPLASTRGKPAGRHGPVARPGSPPGATRTWQYDGSSGNAVRSCARTTRSPSPACQLEAAIVATFGFESRVIVRTEAELADAISADPLLDLVENPSQAYGSASPLGSSPRQDDQTALTAMTSAMISCRIVEPTRLPLVPERPDRLPVRKAQLRPGPRRRGDHAQLEHGHQARRPGVELTQVGADAGPDSAGRWRGSPLRRTGHAVSADAC